MSLPAPTLAAPLRAVAGALERWGAMVTPRCGPETRAALRRIQAALEGALRRTVVADASGARACRWHSTMQDHGYRATHRAPPMADGVPRLGGRVAKYAVGSTTQPRGRLYWLHEED